MDDALKVVACRSDFNLDSQIDFLDWMELIGKWLEECSAPGWCTGMDLDFSKRIGLGDMAFLAQEWLATTE